MQDRVLGSAVVLQIFGSTGAVPGPISLGEVDEFSAKSKSTLHETHPLGNVQPHGQLIYGGYDLSFKFGTVDDSVHALCDANDLALLAGQPAPRYQIVETITYRDGTSTTITYRNVLLYNFDLQAAMSNEEVKQNVEGFAATRDSGAGLGALNVINSSNLGGFDNLSVSA